MRLRLAIGRPALLSPARPSSHHGRLSFIRLFVDIARASGGKSRPSLPFLFSSHSGSVVARSFTSDRRHWLRQEVRLVLGYTVAIWGFAGCILLILFAVNEELLERKFPTPHEWSHLTRKFLRDANNCRSPVDGRVNWPGALELAREVILRLEDPKVGGKDITALSDARSQHVQPGAASEFVSYDVSAKSEPWRRGYFEALMLAAKAAEHVDGWLRDVTRNIISAPEFVVGSSNPLPKPIPPGSPQAPREEDCELAYPSADSWYLKILATKGLTSRQRLEAALEYASFTEFKGHADEPEALYQLALAEASRGLDKDRLPYDDKTLVLRQNADPPSKNILDVLTAVASFKARKGDLSSALPIYLSLLRARRALPTVRSKAAASKIERPSLYQQMVGFLAPPDYPPPPPDGTRPPWRSPRERCREAALNLYIGEILYVTSSRDEGLSWTREGVDAAEEQLRSLSAAKGDEEDQAAKETCRECLAAGFDNWSAMVSLLARREEEEGRRRGAGSKSFSFWSRPQEPEDRWAAEEAVVKERVSRTRELMEDIAPASWSFESLFKA